MSNPNSTPFTTEQLEYIKRIFKSNQGINNESSRIDYFDALLVAKDKDNNSVAVVGIRLKVDGYMKEIAYKNNAVRSTGINYYPYIVSIDRIVSEGVRYHPHMLSTDVSTVDAVLVIVNEFYNKKYPSYGWSWSQLV